MYMYALKPKVPKPCIKCGVVFPYITKGHRIIVGSKKEMEWLKGINKNSPFSNCEIVGIDTVNCDCYITFEEYVGGKETYDIIFNKKEIGNAVKRT